MKQIFNLILVLLFPVCAAFAQDPDWYKLSDDALNSKGAEIIRKLLNSTNEAEMLVIVKPSTNDDLRLRIKIYAYKRLAIYGTKAAVPVLVEKLEIPKEGFYARYALESIPGKEVDAALCEITGSVKKPEVLAGILTTLGVRTNPESAVTAKSFLTHADPNVKQSAAYAYASTAGIAAVDFFTQKQLDSLFADSAFLLAEILASKGDMANALKIYDTLSVAGIKPYQKEAALAQSILARGEKGIDLLVAQLSSELPANFDVGLKVARELPAGVAVTKSMLAVLDKQTDSIRKAKLIRSIGDRKDNESKKISVPVLSEFVKSGDETVRIAAIESFKNIGDSSVLPILIDAAKQKESAKVAQVALWTLQNMPGKDDVNTAIGELLVKGDKAARIIAINLIKERRITSAYPILNKSLIDPDAGIVAAATDAIGQTAGLDDLPLILDLFIKAQKQEDSDKYLVALKSACTRLPQNAAAAKVFDVFEKSPVPVKVKLLEVFNVIGGKKSVEIVERCAWEDAVEVQNKATEILGKWVSQNDIELIAAVCLKLAKDSKYKNRGLRGYIRLARQFSMKEEDRLKFCQNVYDLASRDEERLLIFDVYVRYPSPKMLDAAAKYFDSDSEKVREKAAETIVAIAEKLPAKSHKAASVIKRIIDESKNETLKEKAKRIFEKQ
ncbi:MAG: HEAT repeat domain-containing protein [Planctomycetaceae bacterium]|jgi:HEAT repeat protein|nr:HEAT repeat domain-containing protein [Planctomycetaceae bacterium]